jgi:hypothetical protein
MVNIIFEDNGFTLEQKFKGKKFKTFIYFDNVSKKIGYYNSIGYSSLVLVIIFGIMIIMNIYNKVFNVTSIILMAGVIYFFVDFLLNLQKYKTLSLTNSSDLYFKKIEYKYIEEILHKRDKYFYNYYFQYIDNFNDKFKENTLNWLYKEEVVTKSEILKIDYINYNEERNEFYVVKK